MVAQAGIAVTGSVVRVTGSGLGCPTWPQCFPGSLVPDAAPGGRGAAPVGRVRQPAAHVRRRARRGAVLPRGAGHPAAPHRGSGRLALVQPLGVVAQAVIGGFTVLLGLVWWSVSVHFLVSMVLVWLAVQLVSRPPGDGGEPAAPARAPGRARARSRRAPPCSRRCCSPARSSPPRARTRATPTRRGWPPGSRRWPSCTPTCCSATSACSSGSASRCAPSARRPALLRRYRLLVAAVVVQGVARRRPVRAGRARGAGVAARARAPRSSRSARPRCGRAPPSAPPRRDAPPRPPTPQREPAARPAGMNGAGCAPSRSPTPAARRS